MKRRFSSHMTLIELTLALFFLMLAMVTIIGLFTTAYSMSVEADRLTRATQLAQDCAALVEGSEDPMAELEVHGYNVSENTAYLTPENSDLTVTVALEDEQTEVGILYTGAICVAYAETNILEWPVARYIIRK